MSIRVSQDSSLFVSVLVDEDNELPDPARNGILVNITLMSFLVRDEQQMLALSHPRGTSQVDFQGAHWTHGPVMNQVRRQQGRKSWNPKSPQGRSTRLTQLSLCHERRNGFQRNPLPAPPMSYFVMRQSMNL